MDVQYVGERLLPGIFGNAFVIISFVASILATISFFMASRAKHQADASWLRLGRIGFIVHSVGVLGIVAALFYIIYSHLFEYHYAWAHSSTSLPVKYIVSSFWEGQEGSFLLWTFWNAFLGWFLMKWANRWEAPVMTIISLAQIMLSSMLIGVYVLGYKFGSSPFILLREVLDAPIFSNPDYLSFIEDGNGLNPLLQNPWMVIHPPILFLGFASTIVPFAYAIGSIAKGDFTSWIHPALPWALFGVMIFGVGIMLGGAWAYESLTFGGYWAWDPVENASLVPWLTMIAATHTMVAFKRSGTAMPTTVILIALTYLLVLYATFLTRSGVLGESSVHSFTDLGLSGQLLAFLFVFIALTLYVVIKNWKHLPISAKEEKTYSREFWMFMGALVLGLSSLHIFAVTSIPVFNKILGTNLAPPADPISAYNKYQLPLAIIIMILTVVGQFLKYKDTKVGAFWRSLLVPSLFALLITFVVGYFAKFSNIQYDILMFSAAFSFIGNFQILAKQFKKIEAAGGAIAHIGFAIMLVGILISSGKKTVLSKNVSGLSYGEAFNPQENAQNVLLWKGEPTPMGDFMLTYVQDSVSGPNIYYRVDYQKFNKDSQLVNSFTLMPNAQINPKMGLISNPDTKHYLLWDLYTHVTQVPDKAAQEKEAAYDTTYNIKLKATGDTVMLDDKLLIMQKLRSDLTAEQKERVGAGADLVIFADILIKTGAKDAVLQPIFALKNSTKLAFDVEDKEIGFKVWFENIDPKTGMVDLRISQKRNVRRDYIIMKAIVFPYINFLWFGLLVVSIGFTIATVHRHKEKVRYENRSNPA